MSKELKYHLLLALIFSVAIIFYFVNSHLSKKCAVLNSFRGCLINNQAEEGGYCKTKVKKSGKVCIPFYKF
ncbi:MAG: hypothetical protein A2534_02320 [Candidatus Magasanikbacteria bacterium RIFOXYD2_FULL_39_9]|uniref:Uncharacterized protein n=1 Tax=Candidatus Magasanikbacteria bacterium RIFOXYD1_FULL_40_23 TaxID=1798705 RepID=A0A1F6PBD2_9BACT|nr:MAG: hypothetical protein A2534_02320 [Candidatus Magasanikbacteria bacterium RIFOXYD2_FULL_39_9]OGH93360.1 MAG: hypothetical protein A2563_02000 [Candidatus Magasanikbacteria bacterium RIFOXYD1_FULL_40_23]